MKRLLLFPVAMPICGVISLWLSSIESALVSYLHPGATIGEVSFDFIFSPGLALGMLPVPVFLLWDLLRNKRRPLSFEAGFSLFFRQLPWPLFYATILILCCILIPGSLWVTIERQALDFTGIMIDQALTPYIINPAAILFASIRFVLRSEPASPRLLWKTFTNSWKLVPSRP